MPEKYKRDPWRGRRCLYCKVVFVPNERADARTADGAKFCCKKHKDRYRFNGGLNFDQLAANVSREVVKKLLSDDKFGAAMADKLRTSELRTIIREEMADLKAAVEALQEWRNQASLHIEMLQLKARSL